MEGPTPPCAKASGSRGYAFLDRLCRLAGKAQAAGDGAGYHVSNASSSHVEGDTHRLRRMSMLLYTPDYNATGPQIRMTKGAVPGAGPDSRGAMRDEPERCVKPFALN